MKPTCIYIYIYLYPISLTSMTGSCRLLCYRTPVKVEWWLSLAKDRKYIIGLLLLGKYKWWKGKMVTGQGYGWVLVGVRGCVLQPTGHSLVTFFPCLCRLRTGRCISLEANHRSIIPSTYLGMGTWKTVALLSWVPALFRPTDWRRGWWRSLHRTKSGTQEWGFGVQVSMGPRPYDRRVMGWSYLCLGYKRGMCFWGS